MSARVPIQGDPIEVNVYRGVFVPATVTLCDGEFVDAVDDDSGKHSMEFSARGTQWRFPEDASAVVSIPTRKAATCSHCGHRGEVTIDIAAELLLMGVRHAG